MTLSTEEINLAAWERRTWKGERRDVRKDRWGEVRTREDHSKRKLLEK